MLTLDFDEPVGARASIVPREGSWEDWLDDRARRPAYLGLWSGAEVCGHAGAAYRLGGFFVEPLESVVGLRPFDDVLEGTVELEQVDEPVPFAIFEVEKISRMMLHQSTSAFEILSTPHWVVTPDRDRPCRAARDIVRRTVTSEILDAYRQTATDRLDEDLDGGDLRAVARRAATALALSRRRGSLHLGRMLDELDEQTRAESTRATAERLIEELESVDASLPDSPSDYDGLDQWLVETRLTHRRDPGSA